MNIVFVCDTLGPGGAERVISVLSNGLVEHDHNVSIVMLSKEATEPFYKLDKRVSLTFLTKNANGKMNFFIKSKTLREHIVQLNPDIVIAFLSYVCIYTWFALKNTGIPYIVSERNDPNQRHFLKQLLLNHSFKNASGCVFQTEDALQWYNKVCNQNCEVIHNPVNLDFCPSNVFNRKKQILYVGRFSDQKNCLMLLKSFSLFLDKHPDYILKMYGSGVLEEEINNHIKLNNLDNNVIISSNSKTWQMEEFDSAMFVLPSKYEGMPNVLAEALCLGMPSVSTNCTIGGPKELKKIFKNQLVLSASIDEKSFFEAMEQCITIPPAQQYGVPIQLQTDTIVLKWIKFIENTLKTRKYVR